MLDRVGRNAQRVVVPHLAGENVDCADAVHVMPPAGKR